MEKDEVFYQKNVPYRLGVRMDLKDSDGVILDDDNPYVAVQKDDLRKFIQANRSAIDKGKLIEIDAPAINTTSVNSMTDDEAFNLVKNFHGLRKRLPEITSDVTILKLLNAAKSSKRSEATIKLIMERFDDVSPQSMQGITNQ